MKGSPARVADQMQDWFKSGACDGFMLVAPVMPHGLRAIADLLVPELQRRGLFRTEYPGRTLRDIIGLASPDNANFPS